MKMEELIDISYDEDFTQIESLKWYPWIGRRYKQSSKKLLIVGESHYMNHKDDLKYREWYEKSNNNKAYTRCCIYESAIKKCWSNKTYRNISKLFLRTDNANEFLWEQVAFYNIIQLIMDYRIRQRPNRLFAGAWKTFVDVIKVIEPTDCIFIGVSASNTFNKGIRMLGLPYTNIRQLKKVGRTYPRKSSINIDGRDINILFVKHTSQFFSWNAWNKFLLNENPELMEELTKTQQ